MFDIPPADREALMYGVLAIWIAANLIVYWLTADDFEFYDRKTGAPSPWYKVAYFACFSTIIAQIRLWWAERKETK